METEKVLQLSLPLSSTEWDEAQERDFEAWCKDGMPGVKTYGENNNTLQPPEGLARCLFDNLLSGYGPTDWVRVFIQYVHERSPRARSYAAVLTGHHPDCYHKGGACPLTLSEICGMADELQVSRLVGAVARRADGKTACLPLNPASDADLKLLMEAVVALDGHARDEAQQEERVS